jgi:hypothetical protein
LNDIDKLAENNGWKRQSTGLLGWWTRVYERGNERVQIRIRANKITGATLTSGQRITSPKQAKRPAVVDRLTAKP